jgi:CRP-like cAMP-binding protein
LVRLAREEGQRTPNGIEITLPSSHQEVAAQIGTVRELVSRNLSRFQAEGLITLEGRNMIIRDLNALETEMQAGD